MSEAAPGVFYLSKHRLEALTDGIFAVAMTLLVIDLKIPETLIAENTELKERVASLQRELSDLHSRLALQKHR